MDNIESKIGQKAKNLRNAKQITLKELSEKTNLSVGYLSQFERGISTIAVDSLIKIAKVYEVDLNYFFPTSNLIENKSIIIKSYEQEVLDVIGNSFIVKLLSNGTQDHKLYPRMVEILPKFSPEKIQAYAHEGEEFVYVLKGILTLISDDEKYFLYPGDSAHYFSTKNHNWTNETNETVQLLCISVPNPFNKDFQQEENNTKDDDLA